LGTCGVKPNSFLFLFEEMSTKLAETLIDQINFLERQIKLKESPMYRITINPWDEHKTDSEIEAHKWELRNLQLKLSEYVDNTKNNDKAINIVKYWDISFNLHNRTLEIGIFNQERSLNNIDKTPEELKTLWKNTTTSIMLLYCIIRNVIENNSIEIKDTFWEYKKYWDEFSIQTWFKIKWNLSDFKTYISKARKILELTWSKYEISKNKKPFKFQTKQ
jgi:hypothetical protein